MAEKVELSVGSKERVAYDLMLQIANYEDGKAGYMKPDPRTYFLTLFNQCYRAGNVGLNIPEMLEATGHKT